MSAAIAAIAHEYEQSTLSWDAAQSDARRANELFDRMHALSNQLRQSVEGREAMEGLLNHDNRGVRLSAAAACLGWIPERAIVALTSLLKPRGSHTLSAETTLREYEAGRLEFEW